VIANQAPREIATFSLQVSLRDPQSGAAGLLLSDHWRFPAGLDTWFRFMQVDLVLSGGQVNAGSVKVPL
jgi:hypothetical protein